MSRQYAVIIGSGFDAFVDAADGVAVTTRFGRSSAPVRQTDIAGTRVLTLARHGGMVARHGDRHTIPPHAINYRANLVALAETGAEAIVALNTVGVITRTAEPGGLAVPADLIDYSWGRAHTLYDGSDDTVEHIELDPPFTESLRAGLLDAARAANVPCVDGGVYAVTQGPRLETAAEIDRLERDGADYVGMTAMPEAALARELGIDYACLALIVNLAAGRGERSIHADLQTNTLSARRAAISVLRAFFQARGS